VPAQGGLLWGFGWADEFGRLTTGLRGDPVAFLHAGYHYEELWDFGIGMMHSRKGLLGCCIISVIILVSPTGVRSAAGPTGGITAITTPSKDVTLSFVQPGRVAEVLVKQGDLVKTGQLLVQQDDAIERAQLEQLQAKSEDTTQIEAAQASLQQKRVDLKRLEWAAERGSATVLEVEHARLDVKIAELSLKLAQFEHEQDRRKYNEARIRVEKMRMLSPIDGRIEKLHCEVGESVDVRADVIRVVQTDPLWIDVPVPLVQAKGISREQIATVRFSGSNAPGAKGKVIHIAAVADAASATLTVRVEVPNPSGRPAGEHVRVSFPNSGQGNTSSHSQSNP